MKMKQGGSDREQETDGVELWGSWGLRPYLKQIYNEPVDGEASGLASVTSQ